MTHYPGGEGIDYFDCGSGKDKLFDFNLKDGDVRALNCES
jgi:hypothetical protein